MTSGETHGVGPRLASSFVTLRPLRIAAGAEAATYLVLLAAAVDRRIADHRDLVPLAGLLHGVVFLIYLAVVVRLSLQRSWSAVLTVTLLAAAFVPFGTVVAERRLLSEAGSGWSA
jgi:integral membrane protein